MTKPAPDFARGVVNHGTTQGSKGVAGMILIAGECRSPRLLAEL